MQYKDISVGDLVSHYNLNRIMKVDNIRGKDKTHHHGNFITTAFCSWEQDGKIFNDIFDIACLNPAIVSLF